MLPLRLLWLAFGLSVVLAVKAAKRGVTLPYSSGKEYDITQQEFLLQLPAGSCKLNIIGDQLTCKEEEVPDDFDVQTKTLRVNKQGQVKMAATLIRPNERVIQPHEMYELVVNHEGMVLMRPIFRQDLPSFFFRTVEFSEELLHSAQKVVVTIFYDRFGGVRQMFQRILSYLGKIILKRKTADNAYPVLIPARPSKTSPAKTPIVVDVTYNTADDMWVFAPRKNLMEEVVSLYDLTEAEMKLLKDGSVLTTLYSGGGDYSTKELEHPEKYKNAVAVYAAGKGVYGTGVEFITKHRHGIVIDGTTCSGKLYTDTAPLMDAITARELKAYVLTASFLELQVFTSFDRLLEMDKPVYIYTPPHANPTVRKHLPARFQSAVTFVEQLTMDGEGLLFIASPDENVDTPRALGFRVYLWT